MNAAVRFPRGFHRVFHKINEQLLQLISLGRAIAVMPESARAHLGRDLVAVPLPDAPKVTTVIAWPPHSRSRALAGLVRAATRL